MPIAVREQVVGAVQSTLQQLSGVSVRRNPDTPAESLPAIDLFDTGKQDIGEAGGGVEEWFLEVPIDLFASDGPALNDLEARAWQKLASNRSLGGIAIDIQRLPQDGGTIDEVEGHPKAISREMPVQIHYWTREGDPFAVGP